MKLNNRVSIIVPAAKVKAVNAILERHGYGPNNITQEVIGKLSADSAKATHYTLDCAADDGLAALVKNVIAKELSVVAKATSRKKNVMAAELSKLNLKKKPVAVDISAVR